MKKPTLEQKLENRQYRQMNTLEIRTEDQEVDSPYLVEGYAMKFAPYPLYEDRDGHTVYEEFRKEAFENADLSDVIFQYDHQGKVLARMSNDTLKVSFDEIGMKVSADLSKSQASRELFNEIKEGLVTKMSWGFRVGDYDYDDKTRTIIHNSIKQVYDVSAVGIPANNDTVINARKFVNGVIDAFEAERLAVQKRKKKLALKIEIEKELK